MMKQKKEVGIMFKNVMFFMSISVFLITMTFGCTTVRVPISVTHPAEINMKKYEQIAISDINGNMGNRYGDELKNKLVESGKFKVVDRNQMDRILNELKLSQSDLTDSTQRAKLGKIMSASALIAGRVDGNYSEKSYSKKRKCYQDKQEYPCTQYYREGVFSLNGGIDVVDVQTGQILRSKVLKSSKSGSTSATDETPEPIDQDSLLMAALDDDLQIFLKAITPWTETCYVPFEKHKKIPELEQAINHAKMGEMDQAINIFSSAIKTAEMNPELKPEHIAQTYWNLGLAYEYTFEFDKAMECFKKGYTLDPDSKFIAERKNAEKLKAEKAKLDEQS